MSNTTKWIGLIEVRPKAGVDVFDSSFGPNNAGAFSTTIVLATNEAEARKRIQEELNSLGLDLVDFTEVDLLSERMAHYEIDPEVLAMADRLSNSRPVGFHEFAVFPLDKNDDESP